MDVPVCSIKRGTARCKVIQEAKVIVIDEALMTNRHAFEALDRTLRDLTIQWKEYAHCCVVTIGK